MPLTLFNSPIGFPEAKANRQARALLPTKLLTKDLDKIRPTIRQAAQFSAQTSNAMHVQTIKDVMDRVTSADSDAIGWGKAMQELRNSLDRLKYRAQPGEEGTITDLRSDPRVRLIVETNQKMNYGFGYWAQSQDETVLDLWPGAELYRAEDRKEWRDWPTIWEDNGGRFFEGHSDYPRGRMIALKNDEIWKKISRFGLPYPPFDFNSGMSNDRDVARDVCEAEGLIEHDEHVVPEDVELAMPKSTLQLDDDLKQALLDDLGPGYEFATEEDGTEVLQRA